MNRTLIAWVAVVGGVVASFSASGQLLDSPGVRAAEPGDPARAHIRERNKYLSTTERELKKLRFEHFGKKGDTVVRQEGLAKLRTYTDPRLFEMMIAIFQGEEPDVRRTLLEHFEAMKSDEGDAALAYAAVSGKSVTFRDEATQAVSRRVGTGPAPKGVEWVIAAALRGGNPGEMAAAADLAGTINLYQAIPLIVQAQAGGTAAAGGTPEPKGDLAYIFVGRQQSFVSDLTPVVAEGAVGFDPTVSVLTTGTLLRVSDAVVSIEVVELNRSLVDFSTRFGGADTTGLGLDTDAWRRWLREVYEPKVRELELAKATPAR